MSGLPPHNKYAPTNSNEPVPVGFCDRCNSINYLHELNWQFDWRGPDLVNLFLRVCRRCYDVPQEQGRVIIIGPDPVPLKDPRPGWWATEQAETGVPPIPPYVIDEDT